MDPNSASAAVQTAFPRQPRILKPTATRLSYWFNFNIDRQKGQLFAAFGTLAFVLMKNFIGRPEVRTFIQNVIASLTDNALRHAVHFVISGKKHAWHI
jgi:hypothetical protein